MSLITKPRPIRLTSVYEVCCAHCGEAMEYQAVEGVCTCGQAYRLDWQAPYTLKLGPPPPSLENGA